MELLRAADDPVLWLGVLAVLGLALLVTTVMTTRRPRGVADLDGFLDRWQAEHGGYDPRAAGVWVRGWLRVIFRVARPLARAGVAPDVLTAWTLWLALAVLTVAALGGRWAMLAGWLVLLGGVGDGLDGAVAAMTDRATRWGYVLDSIVDRVNELLYLAAMVLLGAPGWLAAGCGAAFFLLEYTRARAGNAGGDEVGRITVGERANRVACAAVGIHFAGVVVARAGLIVTIALAGLAALSVIGLGQLLVAVRRDLVTPGR